MKSPQKPMRTLLLGGILPVVAYTIVEEVFGIFWGLVAGMVIGVGEILFEWINHKKVEPITLGGTGLILALGAISLFTQEGLWFKLQPAIMEAVMGVALLGSVAYGKPLLVLLAEKQGMFEKLQPQLAPLMKQAFSGLTVRISLFFFLHAALATWAAFYWSTRAWAILKGVGFTASIIVYMLVEIIWIRRKIKSQFFSVPRNHLKR